jgi:hypothetical protein
MIRTSLELERKHHTLNQKVSEMSDDKFLTRYRKLLRDAQKQNPPLRSPYARTRHREGKKTSVFTAITPIADRRAGDLRNALEALPPKWAPAKTTHFARLIPFEEVMWRTLPKKFKGMEPITPCLVFGASFDGEKEAYLEELHAQEHVWQHCKGWQGGDAASFSEYLLNHEYKKTDLPYCPYEGVPKDVIESALALNEKFWAFAVKNQQLTTDALAGKLRKAWMAEFL